MRHVTTVEVRQITVCNRVSVIFFARRPSSDCRDTGVVDTWLGTIEADIRLLNLLLHTAFWHTALDSQEWHETVGTATSDEYANEEEE